MVLDSDKENEAERLINVQGPNIQRECLVEVSNANNEETEDLNSGRGIRDGPLRLNMLVFLAKDLRWIFLILQNHRKQIVCT